MKEQILLRRIRFWLGVLIAGLILSGLTAFPLQQEVPLLVKTTDVLGFLRGSELAAWLRNVQAALANTDRRFPFLAYGTDWLGFAHLVIAVSFIGAWREPVRNRWLFTFGLISCVAVIPFALIAGGFRNVPLAWRMIDCSFGVAGAIPLWICRQAVAKLESLGS